MAYTQMTPQERMQRAAQLRAMREARLGYTPTDDSLSRYLLPTERSVGVEPVQPVQASQPTQQSGEGFDLGRWGATGLDVVSKVATVPFQFFEGIFDMGAGFIGNVGGWFSEEFKNEVEKVANFNATDEWLRKPMDEAGLKHSYLNEEGAGQFFDQIFNGVGQVGTVAALSLIPGFGTGAAIATMGASAGGGAMQEALSEGADLGEAMNYGVVSGAIEGGTEALLGGIPLFGKGIAKGAKAAGKEVAEMGGKRILKGMVEEGAEEALATFASPLAKTTYKGVDAIGEYFEPEFYGDVLKDAASGALVSAAYGGTIGHALHQSGKDADISAAQDSIKELTKKRRQLQASEEGLTDDADAQIVESGRKNLENISKVLKDASPKQREALIKRHRLHTLVDAEGNLKPDFALKAFGQASAAPDPQTGRVEEGQSADGRYYSADMRGREDVLQKDAEDIQEALRKMPNQQNATVELFRGELSEEGKKHLRETYGAMNTLSELTPTGMSIALVDSDGGMDGVVLGNRIYLDYRVVENGTFAKPLVEEVSHFSEGTETYADAIKFISEDDVLRQGVYDALTGDGNAYGFTTELADRTIEKQKNGEELTDEESTFARELNAHMSAEALGNETFMKKLVKGKPNLAKKLIARIKALQAALSKSETPEARTQRKRLAKAEKLWMQAVEDAGAKKSTATAQSEGQKFFLHGRSTADNARLGDVSRMNSERMQVTESVDKSEEMRYNEVDFNDEMEAIDDAGEGAPSERRGKLSQSQKDIRRSQEANRNRSDVSRRVGEGTERNERLLVLRGRAGRLQLEKYEFSEDSVVLPNPGSIEANEQKRIADYGVESFVIQKTAWNRESLAGTKNGRIYMREDIPQSKSGIVAPHELTHVMKQMQYPPYMELLSRTPDALDFSSIKTENFLKGIAVHCGYDFYTATPEQFQQIYDELNCTVYGHYVAGDSTNPRYAAQFRERISNNFKNFDSYIAELESIHKQFKEDMLEVRRTLDESDSTQFSPPEKKPSDGARAKSNANAQTQGDHTQKYYLREDVAHVVDMVVSEQMKFGERYGVLDFSTKRDVVRMAWERSNNAQTEKERQQIAEEISAYIVESAVAQKVLSEEDSAFLEGARKIMRKLDLDPIKNQIKDKLGARTSAYMVWGKRRGGESMSISDAKNLLEESGIKLQATEDAEIFFEILERYDGIKQWIKDSSTSVKNILSEAELTETKKAISEDLLSFAKTGGSPVNFSRIVERYERRINRLNTRLEEQYKSAKLIRDIAFRAERLKKLKLGKMHEASGFNAPMFRKSIGSLGSIVRAGQISEKKAREISAELARWLKWMEEQDKDASGENGGRSFNLKTLREFLEDIADPERQGKPLNVNELKNLSYVMARLTTYVNDYGKIRRKGKMIAALPVAEGYVDKSKKLRKLPRGPLRVLREWYIGKFADPATVMRYADGYDENGFFTETFEEFREGAITVEVTRMELMEPYAKFFEEHKKYEDRLAEYVEFRGRKIPRNVLISLWMTTKRRQAQLGLATEGAQYRAKPDTKEAKKTDDGTRVFDIAPFGDPTRDLKNHPYTDIELEAIMKEIRTEIEKSLNDLDRAYIEMVEGIFSECGKIKRDVDMKRNGDTNVDEDQYYFPIARADVAQTIEQESWQQGLDRVSHLSMNKDTVKGAHNRLYLGGVDAILGRHVNQVSLYNGIASAVDNFNILVNLEVNDTGAAITVNNTVTRTDDGKAALDYIKKLKNDIERVNLLDIDDAGVTKALSYLRSAYATSTLGANPKVWLTQLSSFIAANNALDADSIAKGFTLPMKKVPKSSAANRSATKIVAGMSSEERASVLQGKSIQPHPIQIADGFDVDWDALEKNQWGKIKKPLLKRMRELGFLKSYSSDAISVDFDFTGEGFRKSMNSQVSDYGGNLGDLAKVVMNLQPLLDNAVLIEVHPDKAKGTPKKNARLLQTYVLLSAYAEGNTVTPVQFEVKQYVDDQNRLYLAVAMTKIETGVLSDTAPRNEERTRLIPISDISIPRLIENINPTDENFFKYIPDSMLTDAQRNAKRRALEKEAKKYGRDLSELLEEEQTSTEDEVDFYCPLAKLRNATNTAYEAQSVSARSIGKVNDLLMKPIGAVDRFVIERLWGACQVQVEKDGGAKIGTKENKEAAGKLLERVILETQQNALATERSSAMRSHNEIMKSLTMFSADAMKMIGRFFDAFGEAYVLRQRLKDQSISDTDRKSLEARRKVVHKSVAKSIAVLLSSAAFMAAIAAAFKAFLGQYEEKEPEEVALDITAEGVGNLFGGLPLVRDVYSYFADGFELNMHLLTPVNGLLDATKDLTTLATDGVSGRKISSQDIANAIRKGFYAGGQILGLPAKNVYKYAASVIKLVSPDTGYAVESVFSHKPYAADLKKAIETGDTRMIARIAELATNENYGIYSDGTRKELQKLVQAGYTVFPRSVGDSVTVNGETVELTSAQQTRFEKVYRISDQAVEELVSLKQFKEATEKERATALKYIYDTYYSIALDDLLGTDTEEKRVLFAEILDIEKLAMILAHVSTLTADKDKDGKTVSGSRKNKIVAYVSKLNLTAAEKYAVMGYLGYSNVNGKSQVSSMINRTKLSRAEKEKLLAYCGYAA